MNKAKVRLFFYLFIFGMFIFSPLYFLVKSSEILLGETGNALAVGAVMLYIIEPSLAMFGAIIAIGAILQSLEDIRQ